MRWLSTFNAAAGPRRYLIGGICTSAVFLFDWVKPLLVEVGMIPLIGMPSWAAAIIVALAFGFYWVLGRLVKLERQMKGARLELAQLRKSGVDLRNLGRHLISSQVSLAEWKQDTKDWNGKVIECLKKANEAAAEWFVTLDVVPLPRLKILENLSDINERKAHEKFYKEHEFCLVRLERLIWVIWSDN